MLKKEGTVSISVYYKNWIVESWPYLKWMVLILTLTGAGLKGRGRENIFSVGDADGIARHYDGAKNPIGIAYTRDEFISLFGDKFRVDEEYFHFFPSRALPFKLPKFINRWLDGNLGFIMYMNLIRVK
ncbi:hypothetical protein FD967_01680 [Polynucleobacter sp. JS-Mosq-20-D10]|uniref:hypothetical protein n=1 Tax=Polynucleobacter sp. JS-Mosq-20-D10 TaxID=2576922 RepID=UPI001BFE4D4B|nr:hypothetical protein [Polynucleobacter sp. JS-Mosq-20-D10]QWE00780.1 hypothetical protein FD967_01680 [Polynucleobacter sp. JS-Mosq-20-D10]